MAGGARSGTVLTLVLLGVAAALSTLVLVGMSSSAVYSKPVDELLRERAKFAGRPVRVEGNLVHGSLERREQPCEYRFRIEKNGTTLPVSFPQCVVPDTFRDVPGMDVGVTAEGSLQRDGAFLATSVLAKCPSKYEMRDRQQKGESAPHAADMSFPSPGALP
jgi:cytochrome c-type biogenesis protein CcmE